MLRQEAIMTERSSEGLDVRRRKLLFRAWRRGVREMDLIVGRFADVYIDKFDEPALDHFERLIEVPNTELYAWVTGDETGPPEHDNAVLRQLIGFHAGLDAQTGTRSREGH
ncbi:MAG: succinate dehydrogenase assembly factor 2 [Xanthobacteraceae bacterium]|jgi:antitoxin CptB